MIRDITIGQYYPAESPIHALDPRVKIRGVFIYLVSLFIVKNLVGYIVAACFLMAVIKRSKVPMGYIVKGLKPIVILMLITAIFNLFLTKTGPVLLSWKIFTITEDGLRMAVLMTIRLIFLIMGASLLTFTVTPNALTDGLEKIFKPLSVFKVPVHEIAMMMSIALRFIPILVDETDKVMKAQMARGADLESGNIIQKSKAMIPILVPLFISAFRRAVDLSMAMEARCYRGGDGRTKMKPLVYDKKDKMSYIFVVSYLILMICMRSFVTFKIGIF